MQAGCDIDAIAIDVVVVRHDDIAEIDPDAQLEMTVGRRPRFEVAGCPLHLDSAGKRFNDAGEIGEQSVAGGRDDPPRMAGNDRVNRAPQSLQRILTCSVDSGMGRGE